mgnify:FL=1
MKVIFDSNVLISAFLWSGRSSEIKPILRDGSIEICFSEETLSELIEVISRPKFENQIQNKRLSIPKILKELINPNARFFEIPKNTLNILEKDPTDDQFLYLAREAKAEYIVSGDKVLLELKKYKGARIVSVEEFLKVFSK